MATNLYAKHAPESIMRGYPYGYAMAYEPLTLFRGEDYDTSHEYSDSMGYIDPSVPLQAIYHHGYKYDNRGIGSRGYEEGISFAGPSPQVQIRNKKGELVWVSQAVIDRAKGPQHGSAAEFDRNFGEIQDTARFVDNTVKTAGHEVGKVVKPIQTAVGDVSNEIGQVPIVGGLLQGVFDITYHATMWPAEVAIAVVIDGKRIDNAVLDQIKNEVKSVKQVAPYAQMVISIVPGIGPGVSAALSAGLALAEGQPIEEVLKAGLIGAIPGGPLVKAAVTMGVETIKHVAKGENVDIGTLMQTAGGAASSALGLPDVAKNALMAGVATMGSIVKGQPLDKALTDGAINALPISNQVKSAMTEATAITLDLAHGKKVDSALLSRLDTLSNLLPVDHALRDSIKSGLSASKKIAQGSKPEEVLSVALQSGIGDSLVSMGATNLPDDVKKGIKSGVALGTGVVNQARRAVQLVDRIPGKLVESGIQLAKAHPLFGEARKIAATQGATRGFDLGTGLLQQQVTPFDIATTRNALADKADKLGFDMACATRIGAVTNPQPPTVSATAHAGHAIAKGMQGYAPGKKQVMMATLQNVPSAAVGATVAVKEVAAARDSVVNKILRGLGL